MSLGSIIIFLDRSKVDQLFLSLDPKTRMARTKKSCRLRGNARQTRRKEIYKYEFETGNNIISLTMLTWRSVLIYFTYMVTFRYELVDALEKDFEGIYITSIPELDQYYFHSNESCYNDEWYYLPQTDKCYTTLYLPHGELVTNPNLVAFLITGAFFEYFSETAFSTNCHHRVECK